MPIPHIRSNAPPITATVLCSLIARRAPMKEFLRNEANALHHLYVGKRTLAALNNGRPSEATDASQQIKKAAHHSAAFVIK